MKPCPKWLSTLIASFCIAWKLHRNLCLRIMPIIGTVVSLHVPRRWQRLPADLNVWLELRFHNLQVYGEEQYTLGRTRHYTAWLLCKLCQTNSNAKIFELLDVFTRHPPILTPLRILAALIQRWSHLHPEESVFAVLCSGVQALEATFGGTWGQRQVTRAMLACFLVC